MNLKKIFTAGIVIWVVDIVFILLTCGWYFRWIYEIPPIIWKAPEEMTTFTSIFWTYLLKLLVAVIFVLVFAALYKGLPGKGASKGLAYGFIIWLVCAFSGMIIMPFYMTIAPTVIVYWIMQALALNIINGLIVGSMYKNK